MPKTTSFRCSRAGTVSPSRLGAVLACPRQARLDEGRRSRPGPAAQVGLLVHRVLERSAGRLASADVLLAQLEAERGASPPDVVERAAAILRDAAPVDLAHVGADQVEVRFDGVQAGEFAARGIVDRVDVGKGPDGATGLGVVIVDYKTGAVRARAELVDAPQTVIYMAWAAAEFFPAGVGACDSLHMVYDYVGSGTVVRIDYDPDLVRAGLRRAGEVYRAFLDEPDPPPRLNASCDWCEHQAGCPAYRALVLEAQPPPPQAWGDLPTGALVALRHQVARDAAMLEAARREIDQTLLGRLADDGAYADDAHAARVASKRGTTYAPAVLPHLARVTGATVAALTARLCVVSTTKARALAREHPAAARVLDAHASVERGAPYVTVRAVGGLF